MLFSVIHYLQGYLMLRVSGTFIERFLNLCTRAGIYMWRLRKTGKNEAELCVSVRGFRRMRHAARTTKTRVKILRKRGLPLFLHRHRRRGAFIVGIAVFALVLAVLTSFVWAIEITPTEKIDENSVRNALKACGLDVGVIKYTIKSSALKESMLRKMPSLAWIWVEVRGTRAIVTMRERTESPEITPADRPCNIVARCDGVIADLVVKKGVATVQQGDVVQKGALLISGAVDTKHGGALLVHGMGTVTARTWYEESGTFPLFKEVRTDTGNTKKRHTLTVGAARLPLYFGKENVYDAYAEDTSRTQWRLWGDLYLPIVWETYTQVEQQVTQAPLTATEAEAYYGAQLYEAMRGRCGGEVVKTEFSHSLQSDGTITVTCNVECREDIGETKEILEERQIDGEIF